MLSTVSRWALFLSVALHIGLLLVKFSAPQPQQSAAPLMIQLQLKPAPAPAQLDQPTAKVVANRVVAKSVKIPVTAIANKHRSVAMPVQHASVESEVRAVAEAKVPLDLSTAKAIAIQPERQTLVQHKSHPNLVAETKEIETPLTQQLNKAVKPDCRKDHAGAGLLAIPMLLKDAVTDSGCQW